MSDLPPLSQDLEALLEAERQPLAPSVGAAERVARVLQLRGIDVDLRPRPRDLSQRLLRSVLTFLGGALGGALIAAKLILPTEHVVYVDRVVAMPPSVVSAPVTIAAWTGTGAGTASSRPAPAPTSAKVTAASLEDPLAAERKVLDIARAAFASGDAASALAAVDRHAREFPNGALTEEREALRVKSLVLAGRVDEARVSGAEFESRYPNSVMSRSVKASLATIPNNPEMDFSTNSQAQ